jgi:Helix-turn-helix domain
MEALMNEVKVRIPKAAAKYEISQHTIRAMIRDGRLRKFKLGGVTLVSLAEIERLIVADTAKSESDEERLRQHQITARRTRGWGKMPVAEPTGK